MPLGKEIRDAILTYCMRDLPDEAWYENAFDFVKDSAPKERLISEFKNARFIYKMFEGLAAKDELLLAEVKMQVLMYASIFEATIHYVLFDQYYKNTIFVTDQKRREAFRGSGSSLEPLLLFSFYRKSLQRQERGPDGPLVLKAARN